MAESGSSVSDVVAKLRTRFGPSAFDVVEQWDSDVCVVGVTKAGDRARLVYISTCDVPSGRFDVSIDRGTTGEWPVSPSGIRQRPVGEGHFASVDFETLTVIIAEHLGM